MPHAFADNGHGNAVFVRQRRPSVARDVECQRKTELKHFAKLAHPFVQPPLDIAVPLIAVVITQHRQKVDGIVIRIFTQQCPQWRFDPDLQPLPGFATLVDEHVALYVLPFEIAHIHKCHPAGIKAEHKQVARQLQVFMLSFQVDPVNPADLFL